MKFSDYPGVATRIARRFIQCSMSIQRCLPGSQALISISVNVRLGKWERALDQFETRARVLNNNDFYDVEAEENVRIIQHPQPVKAAAGNALFLFSIDCRNWASEILAGARLYFHKNQRVAVTTDDVDLAATASFEIAVEDFVALTPQESAGQFLAVGAAPEMLWPRGGLRGQEAVAPPVRKIGDGSDKLRIHGVSRDAVRWCNLCAG